MRILITGGAGFIGCHLAARLLRNPDHAVAVFDNLYRGNPECLPRDGRLSFIEGDIRNRAELTEAMTGVDVVFHLAAQSNVIGANRDLDYSFSTNVAGTYEVLAAAHRAGARRLIFTSSREVYGDPAALPVAETAPTRPKNAYGASKVAGEEYCRVFDSAGLPVTILRLANVYGPGDRNRVIPILLDNALDGRPLVLYGGDQIIDFVWVDDVTQALVRAMSLDQPDGPVNIGSGTGTTVLELAQTILREIPSIAGVRIEAKRAVEVSAFIADIGRAVALGIIAPATAPLHRLQDLIDSRQARRVAASAV